MINGLAQFGMPYQGGINWGHLLNQMPFEGFGGYGKPHQMPFGMPQGPVKRQPFEGFGGWNPKQGSAGQPGFSPNALMQFGMDRGFQRY